MGTASPQVSRSRIPSQKFALWVGIVSIVMIFGSLTSAYIVRRSAGNWYEFKLPNIFFVNTVVIVLSSVTLHFSYNAFKKGREKAYKILLMTTFALGMAFVILQYEGWQALNAIGATFKVKFFCIRDFRVTCCPRFRRNCSPDGRFGACFFTTFQTNQTSALTSGTRSTVLAFCGRIMGVFDCFLHVAILNNLSDRIQVLLSIID